MFKTKVVILTLVAFTIAVFVGTGMAVPIGKDLEYKGGMMGKVVFSGKLHADKGFKCTDCHPAFFPMKHGATEIKFPTHNEGKQFCFACHNGTKAFDAKGNCTKCHKK